jgi:hypothetical protein
VEGSCEHSNEPLGSINWWEVLEYLHNWQLLKCPPTCVLLGSHSQSRPEALTSYSVKRRRPKKLVNEHLMFTILT